MDEDAESAFRPIVEAGAGAVEGALQALRDSLAGRAVKLPKGRGVAKAALRLIREVREDEAWWREYFQEEAEDFMVDLAREMILQRSGLEQAVNEDPPW